MKTQQYMNKISKVRPQKFWGKLSVYNHGIFLHPNYEINCLSNHWPWIKIGSISPKHGEIMMQDCSSVLSSYPLTSDLQNEKSSNTLNHLAILGQSIASNSVENRQDDTEELTVANIWKHWTMTAIRGGLLQSFPK